MWVEFYKSMIYYINNLINGKGKPPTINLHRNSVVLIVGGFSSL